MISTSTLSGSITPLFTNKPRGKKMAAKKKGKSVPSSQKATKGGALSAIGNAAQKNPGNRWDMKIYGK